MIQVVIGTSHVRAILGYRRGYEFDRALHHALSPLIGWPIRDVRELGELDGSTVYDLMKEFHDLLRRRLTGHPLLKAQEAEIQRVAREEYFIPDFELNTDNAVNFFALHGVFAHGQFAQFVLKGRPGEPAERTSERVQGYLPDFSHGARLVGCLAIPADRVKSDEAYQQTKQLLDYVGSLEASSEDGLPEELIGRARELLQVEAAPFYGDRDPVEAIAGTAAGTSAGAMFLRQRLRHALERILERMESGSYNNVDQAAFLLRRGLAEGEHVDIECHLCDSVRSVYERAKQFFQPMWERIRVVREQVNQSNLTESYRRSLEQERERLAADTQRAKERLKNHPVGEAAGNLLGAEHEIREIEGQLKQKELLPETRARLGRDLLLSTMKRIPESGDDQTLVIDAEVRGFVGYRSLRRDNPDVPTLGRHRLLSAAAIRQGMAKPVISKLFPIQLWRQFDPPVQHFLLDAAQRVAAHECPPVYPDVPSSHEALELFWAAARAEGDCGFETDQHAAPLRRLGLETAFRRRQEQNQNLERSESGEWERDWTRTIFECESSLYDTDIEQSLHLQDVLDLYPLHKRVLGLVEYVIKPLLKDKGFSGGVSSIWGNAFTDKSKKLCRAVLPARADWWSTLEALGNWLIAAEDKGDAFLDLATLLDCVVSKMSSAPEVHGALLTLNPRKTGSSGKFVGHFWL